MTIQLVGNVVHVSATEQLALMEIIADATGKTDYDSIRDELSDNIHAEYGEFVIIEFEELWQKQINEFIEWLQESEGV